MSVVVGIVLSPSPAAPLPEGEQGSLSGDTQPLSGAVLQIDQARWAERPERFPRAVAPRFYRPELDSLRLGAFLMVWISHSLPSASESVSSGIAARPLWWLEAVKEAGNFGVCVFFFLSAYLIGELLRRERLMTGTIHLRAFYVRRILRIWPLYFGVLALYGLVGLRFHGFRIEPGRLLASLLLAGNWYILLHPAILTPMRALWSLSIEEQFYLLWPVLARLISRPFIIAMVCVGLLGFAQVTLLWLAHHASAPNMLHVTAWVNSLVQFQFFALGALVALLLAGRTLCLRQTTRAVAFFAAAAAMLLASGVCGIKRPTAGHDAASLISGYLLVGLGCVLLFAAVLGVGEHRIPRWTVRLGQISFGLYVFHETGFFFADQLEKRLLPHAASANFQAYWHEHWALALAGNKAVSLVFTILLASASYQFWERPFLKLKDRFTFIRSRHA